MVYKDYFAAAEIFYSNLNDFPDRIWVVVLAIFTKMVSICIK